MEKKYKLIYCYRHCIDEKCQVAGYAENEIEAKKWVRDNESGRIRTKLIPDELAHTCPVTTCGMREQKPFFSYREI